MKRGMEPFLVLNRIISSKSVCMYVCVFKNVNNFIKNTLLYLLLLYLFFALGVNQGAGHVFVRSILILEAPSH